jgi:NAD(P)-dependent dehydrogenase (short-subunit alcohol dehydrogenase family)
MRDIQGAVIVLGASRGLGRSIALALAAAGFPVGVACRRQADADAVRTDIEAAGGRAMPLVVDVAHFKSVEAATSALNDWGGSLAGVVNTAGTIDPIGRIADTDPDAWARLISVNIVGAYCGVRAALPLLGNGGVIVNVSSGAASKPMEGWSAYCASKAALAMLTRSIAHEYGAAGILAYGFRPGVVDTGLQAEIRSSGLNPVSQIPQENLLRPEVPAQAIAWLFKARPVDLSGIDIDVRDETFQERMRHQV